MAKLKDDQIRWILSLDAKGIQSELVNISSSTQKLEADNKRMKAEMKDAEKQMEKYGKEMRRLIDMGDQTSDTYKEVEATFRSASEEVATYRKRLIDNTKAIEHNKKVADEMVRTLKVEDMTREQLNKRAKELETQLSKTAKSTHPEQYAALDKELTAVRTRMAELKKGTGDADKTMSAFSSLAVKSLAAVGVGVGAIVQGFKLYESVMMSNKGTGVELKSVMDGLNNTWDYMKTAIATLDFSNFLENMFEAYSIGRDLTLILEKLSRKRDSFSLTSPEHRAEIEDLKTQLRDVTLSDQERIKIGAKLKEKMVDLAEEEKKILKEQTDLAYLKLRQETKLNEAEADYYIRKYNANAKEIEYAEQLIKKEKEYQSIKNPKTIDPMIGLTVSDPRADSLKEEIDKMKASEEFSEIAYNSAKKYALAGEETIKNYVSTNKELLEVDIRTEREMRLSESMMNRLSARQNGGTSPEQRQRNELQVQLTNQENAHKQELQLLEDTRLKEKKTDEEHKIAVAKSDKKYYDERVKLLQDFRKKVTDKKFQADIDSQIVDSTGKSKAQDPIVDKANIDAATKNRDELLKVEQVGTNELKRVQAERDELAQVSTLRQRAIELSSAQNRLEILRQYSKDVQDLEISDAALKEKLVRDANDAVIQAETEAIQKRKALDGLYKNSNDRVRSQYGNVPVSEQMANEKAIVDALYNEKLITEETHQQAILAIEQRYADQKFQIKKQYGLVSTLELYQQELEQLQQKLDQELLTQEEFEKAKKQMQIDYATQAAQKVNQVAQTAANMGNAIQQAATANLEAQYQERIAAAEGNAAEQERLEEELAEKKLELEKKFADVQFAIKAAEIISSTAVAIMVAYKQLGPIAGSIAGVMLGITGAAQLVAANAERKKVKALTLKGSSSKSSGGGGSSSGNISLRKRYAEGGYNDPGIVGGYTGDGGRYEAAGVFPNGSVFDRGEYIVPQPVLKRPASIPYIKALEAMRKPYSTANPLPKRFAEGGFNSYDDEPTPLNGGLSPELIERLTTVLEDLKENGVNNNLGVSELQAKLDQYNKEKERFSLKK